MSEKQRKQTIREAKERQEKAYHENQALERMSPRDPRFEAQQEKMVSTAQECGRRYANWLKAQGRKGQVRENRE
jgi:hypothetical protein